MELDRDILLAILVLYVSVVLSACISHYRNLRVCRSGRKKRMWIRPWISRRPDYGLFEQLMTELEAEDLGGYRNFLRLYPSEFNELVNMVAPLISKQNTNMRFSIPADLRLALTLRFLATGDSYKSHEYSFRVAANTIGKIVATTCEALYTVLKNDYFRCPRTKEEWLEVADGFMQRWQFPHTCGALDGKHIVLRKPANSGSIFFNYKNCFSIVLMALVDSTYKFLYINVGKQGRISDGGIFSGTSLYRALENNNINFPDPKPLPGCNEPMPYFIIGDEAFPLRTYLMKPYPLRHLTRYQRIYNYRICRARRMVENAFGILASRFGVFLKPMYLSPERAELVTIAACALHNYLRIKHPLSLPENLEQDMTTTNDAMPHLVPLRGNNATRQAKIQREMLCNFVNSDAGKTSWQEKMV